jgi:hypothetical protein
MTIQRQEQKQQQKHVPYARIAIATTAFLLLLVGGIIWVLNIQKVVEGPWSNTLAAIFTVFGVVFALFQWLLPVSSKSHNSSMTSPNDNITGKNSFLHSHIRPPNPYKTAPYEKPVDTTIPHIEPTKSSTTFLSPRKKAYLENAHIHIQTISKILGVDKDKGALVVYSRRFMYRPLQMCTVSCDPTLYWEQNITKHVINGFQIWGAFFTGLNPGDYVVYDKDHERIERVSVSADNITEVNWED